MVGSLAHARSQIHHNILGYLYPGDIVAKEIDKGSANERERSRQTNHREDKT